MAVEFLFKRRDRGGGVWKILILCEKTMGERRGRKMSCTLAKTADMGIKISAYSNYIFLGF